MKELFEAIKKYISTVFMAVKGELVLNDLRRHLVKYDRLRDELKRMEKEEDTLVNMAGQIYLATLEEEYIDKDLRKLGEITVDINDPEVTGYFYELVDSVKELKRSRVRVKINFND